jgi:hypothetical protein
MEAVYILKDLSKDTVYKFGRSRNIHQRVGNLQVGSSGELEYKAIMFCKNASLLETKILNKLKKNRIHSEWFNLNDDEFKQAHTTLTQMRDEINKKITTKPKTTDKNNTAKAVKPYVNETVEEDIAIASSTQNINETIDVEDEPEDDAKIIYSCDPCKFKSNYKSNYLRHLTTCNKGTPQIFSCKYCGSPYKTQTPLSTHQNKCSKRDIYENRIETDNKLFASKLENKEIIIDSMLRENESLKAEILKLKKQINDDKKDFKK